MRSGEFTFGWEFIWATLLSLRVTSQAIPLMLLRGLNDRGANRDDVSNRRSKGDRANLCHGLQRRTEEDQRRREGARSRDSTRGQCEEGRRTAPDHGPAH